MSQALFDVPAVYCVDTNVVSSFLSGDDDEAYPIDMFAQHWRHIDGLFAGGSAIMASATIAELDQIRNPPPELKVFLRSRRQCVREFGSDLQLEVAARLVNQFPGFARNQNRANDLEVISLAAAEGLCLVTLEKSAAQTSPTSPKIPNACALVGVECVDVAGLLRKTGFAQEAP